jgi:hypothetical protein
MQLYTAVLTSTNIMMINHYLAPVHEVQDQQDRDDGQQGQGTQGSR